MAKMQKSIYLEMESINFVNKLIKKSRLKNFSEALDWIIRGAMSRGEFYKFMGKFHAGQTQHFFELQQNLKES